MIIALPMFGDYYTPNIVSGSPTTSMLGNQIDIYFHVTSQPTVGAALTLILSAFLVVLMAYYMITVARATREQRGVTAASGHGAAPATSTLRRARELGRQSLGPAALPRAGHLGVHAVGDRPGDDRHPVLLQLQPLAHDLGGILDPLVHRATPTRSQRPDPARRPFSRA